MPVNIWIINHYAVYKKGRHATLARLFRKKGCIVNILLSSYSRDDGYLFKENIHVIKDDEEGVNYIYIKSKPSHKQNGVKRVLNMISFCILIWMNLSKICKIAGKPSHVIASSVHPFVWEIGYIIASKFRAKFVAEIRDIWPLSLIEVQHISKHHPLVLLMNIVEKRAYLRADAIVSTMPYAYMHVCESFNVKREKVYWMPNGINVQQYESNLDSAIELPANISSFLTSHWSCVYTGSIVASECISLMLKAFEMIKDEDIYFAIIGDGHELSKLIEMKNCLGLDKVRFFPKVDNSLICKILQKSHCCIAGVHDLPLYRYGLSLNKLNDYLLSGKPVLFACSYPNVVEEAGQFNIASDNPKKMAETILKIKDMTKSELEEISLRSRKKIYDVYDYNIIADNYLEMLKSL